MPRLESTIERELDHRAKKLGGRTIKLTGYKGIPDRLVLLPGGKCFFAELKSDTGELSAAQEVWHDYLFKLGFPVAVIANREILDLFLPKGE